MFLSSMFSVADAWAKPPEGLLTGHVNPMGDFDECVEIDTKGLTNVEGDGATSFKGRYCTVYLVPSFSTVGTGNDTAAIREAVSPEELLVRLPLLHVSLSTRNL